MKITKDKAEFERQFMQTSLGAFCVKQKGAKFPHVRTGRISVPSVTQNRYIKNDDDLYQNMSIALAFCEKKEVVVIGHGSPTPDDVYVWRGSLDEFKEYWIGD